MKRHLRPDILLFLPIVATSVYQYLNKLMLGNWAVSAEVGFYQNAENIITLPSFLTTAIVTVMLPYSSNLVAKGDNDGNEQIERKSGRTRKPWPQGAGYRVRTYRAGRAGI